jgi:hypothetical protein
VHDRVGRGEAPDPRLAYIDVTFHDCSIAAPMEGGVAESRQWCRALFLREAGPGRIPKGWKSAWDATTEDSEPSKPACPLVWKFMCETEQR